MPGAVAAGSRKSQISQECALGGLSVGAEEQGLSWFLLRLASLLPGFQPHSLWLLALNPH